MKKLLVILFLVALATPMFGSVLPGAAYANDDQGENDDCQGDEDGEDCPI